MKIEAVIFDLGRVLVKVDFTRGLFPYLEGQGAKDDLTILNEVYKNPLFIKYSTGKIDTEELYSEIKNSYGLQLSYGKFKEVWCEVFDLMPGVENLVTQIEKFYKIGLLSDTDPMHWNYVLKHYPFLKKFNKPTLSYETGYLKPDVCCYQKAAENVETLPEQCLFIDDRQINVDGARQAGMQGLQFKSIQQLGEDLRTLGIMT